MATIAYGSPTQQLSATRTLGRSIPHPEDASSTHAYTIMSSLYSDHTHV